MQGMIRLLLLLLLLLTTMMAMLLMMTIAAIHKTATPTSSHHHGGGAQAAAASESSRTNNITTDTPKRRGHNLHHHQQQQRHHIRNQGQPDLSNDKPSSDGALVLVTAVAIVSHTRLDIRYFVAHASVTSLQAREVPSVLMCPGSSVTSVF